ncbi:helix-turn-helix domain-containing protein [Streptococcus fryi]
MQIESLMEKTEQIQYQLITLLKSQLKPMSLKELMRETGLSRVTLMKYIDAMNELFDEHQLDCYLTLEDTQLSFYQGPYVSLQDIVRPFLTNAVKYQILSYLFEHEHFTIQKLSQELLISEATLNRHLASLNLLLLEFNLAIVQGSLLGPEHQRRYFYYELLLQTWSKKELDDQINRYPLDRALVMLERLYGITLSTDKAFRLQLWLSISLQRLSARHKDTKALAEHLAPYEEHVFFQRLERASLHYFGQFAQEFDRHEVDSLFAYLSSHFILPIQTIEYMLGFGGPISEVVTEAIGYLRRQGLLQHKLHEQVIYRLGQLAAQTYFFQGAVSVRPLKWSKGYFDRSVEEDLKPLAYELQGILLFKSSDWLENDLVNRVLVEILKFLIFLQEEQQTTITVGLYTGEDELEQTILQLSLGRRLENNRLIHLEPYDAKKSYDCVITTAFLASNNNANLYYLHHQVSQRDIDDLAIFLKQELQKKNTD